MRSIRKIFIYLSLTYLCTYPVSSSVENLNHQEMRLTKEDVKSIHEIFSLLRDRLKIARDIAKWKWNYRLPIEERSKEKELLKQLLLQAFDDGTDMQFCTNVIMSQIIAAKAVQIQSFENWIENEADLVPFPSSDLVSLEKNMLEIDRKIIHQLMHLYSISDRQDFFSHIAFTAMEIFPEGQVSENVREEMIRPFLIGSNCKELEH